jgi:hypothetical protein
VHELLIPHIFILRAMGMGGWLWAIMDNKKPTIIKASGRWLPKNLNCILQL